MLIVIYTFEKITCRFEIIDWFQWLCKMWAFQYNWLIMTYSGHVEKINKVDLPRDFEN